MDTIKMEAGHLREKPLRQTIKPPDNEISGFKQQPICTPLGPTRKEQLSLTDPILVVKESLLKHAELHQLFRHIFIIKHADRMRLI